jgi:hypothetical protein
MEEKLDKQLLTEARKEYIKKMIELKLVILDKQESEYCKEMDLAWKQLNAQKTRHKHLAAHVSKCAKHRNKLTKQLKEIE